MKRFPSSGEAEHTCKHVKEIGNMITDAKETCAQLPHAERIARLNDALRKTGEGGVIVVTRGVRVLPRFAPAALLDAVAGYDGFDPDNDPHGERDFGDLELFGAELLWKLDYYDLEMRYGSTTLPMLIRRHVSLR